VIRYFAFDTETGGLDNTIHEVLALAYVLLDENAEIVAEGQWFAFPSDDVNVDSFAAKVNGYTRESWAAAGALTQDQLVSTRRLSQPHIGRLPIHNFSYTTNLSCLLSVQATIKHMMYIIYMWRH
jgi:DNA polymerase III alpha subunit (gram-positive type)